MMSERLRRIRRAGIIRFINHFLCGTHFFRIKRVLLRRAGISCGSNTCIVGPIYFGNVSRVSFGDRVWVGTNFSVYGNGEVQLGNNVDIAPDVAMLTGGHEISPNPAHRAGKGVSYTIHIHDGCWIGARVTIMGTITIGRGSIIAAGAIVNRSVEDNVVYGGVHGGVIRHLEGDSLG